MPKKQGKISAWCDRTLFTTPIYYSLCLSEKAFTVELKRLKVKPQNRPLFIANAQSHATTHYFERGGKLYAIICITSTNKHSLTEVHGLLVHEAMHIWQAVLQDIGEDRPSAEFEAYAVQHIAQELFEKFNELGGAYNARTQR